MAYLFRTAYLCLCACLGLLGSIWLLGYMPPKVRNYQNMLRPLVDMFEKYAPGKDPIVVFDSSL